MRASYNLASVSVDFRVNEIEFRQGQLRWAGNDPFDFQIVVKHPFLGPFAVHKEFVFELRSGDGAGDWEKVFLEQLKAAFLQASQNVHPAPAGGEHERTRERLARLSGTHPIVHSEPFPRISIKADSGHIGRAEEALSRAKVHYRIVGGIGSRGRVWGPATFLVDSLPGARTHLLRAGFLRTPESNCVLIDSENGWKIRLLEERSESRSTTLTV